MGSGFGDIEGLAFGPDGALYASDFNGDRIWRIAQQPPAWTTNNLPPGLVAWWQGENNFLDSIGTNHGTATGPVGFTPGRFGLGMTFGGTNGEVVIPYATNLDVPATGFTVEFWMRAGKDQPQTISSIVDKDHSARDGTGWEVSCWRDTGRLSFGIGDGSSFPLATNLTDVLDNQFHHVAFAWDRTNWLIYVNGRLENSVTKPTVANNTRPLRFGYHWEDDAPVPMRFFRGQIDDVRIYHRALSATEIARIALGMPGANGFWGTKTHDPLSAPPTTLFWFDENGENYRELPRMTLNAADIEADGLAMSPNGELFAFQVNSGGGSRLLWIAPDTAAATVIGPVLPNRNIRGAAFTLSGRLLVYDFALKELLEVSPLTGQQLGASVPLSTNFNSAASDGDLTQILDGTLVFANNELLYQLNPLTGALTQFYRDTNPLPDGYVPFCCGIACVPGSEPANKLFGYEASERDSVYHYLPSSNYVRTLLYNNVVPSYNAGRGDLAGLPAAQVELLSIASNGSTVTLDTVCRGGAWAEIVFTDDLSAPNWQTVADTAGWVPYTPGSIATQMVWTNLSGNVSNRFFRVLVR